MRSKELMESIKWNVLTSTILYKEEHLKLCEEVEKDLDRLSEITTFLSNMVEDYGKDLLDVYDLAKYVNKIEEWLKNG